MSVEENKAIVRRFFEAFSRNDVAAFEEVTSRDVVYHTAPPGLAAGIQGYRELMTMYHSAFPDLQLTIDDVACSSLRARAAIKQIVPIPNRFFRTVGRRLERVGAAEAHGYVALTRGRSCVAATDTELRQFRLLRIRWLTAVVPETEREQTDDHEQDNEDQDVHGLETSPRPAGRST
jgi:hypothetical protein